MDVGIVLIGLMVSLIVLVILCRGVMVMYRVAISIRTEAQRTKDEADEIKQQAEEYAAQIRRQTDMQYNKYAALSYNELEQVLQSLYSQQLVLASYTHVSENDPEGASVLHVKSLEGLETYLGPETMQALDYYYGKDFIIRWAETKFLLLENTGVIANIIAKAISETQIEHAMQ